MGASDGGTGFLVLIWVLTAVSFIIVSLRVFAKLRIKQFRLDDVLMTTALIFGIIAAILNTIGINYGYEAGHEANPVSPSATLARKFAILAQAIIVICATLGRAAFVVYLLAILGDQKWQRVTLTTLVVMEIIINVLIVVLLCVSCRPIAFLWDFTLNGSCFGPGVLINYGYFSSAFDIFTDLYLAVVPTYIFWHLQLKLAVKLTLIGLMSCGLVAMGAALAKALQLHEISDTFSTGTTDLLRWSYIEANLVMITSSIPCLRSLVLSGFHYMNSSGHRSRSYELGTALTGTRRGTTSVTAHNNSQHQRVDSRVRNILSSRNNGDDGASAHYILESRNSIDAVKSSESSSQDLRTGQFGIQKQVDVTITSHAHSPDDGDSFK